MNDFCLQADLDVGTAPDIHKQLVEAVENAALDQPFSLELSGSQPTQVALQLLVATARAIDGRGIEASFGPMATECLKSGLAPPGV